MYQSERVGECLGQLHTAMGDMTKGLAGHVQQLETLRLHLQTRSDEHGKALAEGLYYNALEAAAASAEIASAIDAARKELTAK